MVKEEIVASQGDCRGGKDHQVQSRHFPNQNAEEAAEHEKSEKGKQAV
jgi:hypothetical protein